MKITPQGGRWGIITPGSTRNGWRTGRISTRAEERVSISPRFIRESKTSREYFFLCVVGFFSKPAHLDEVHNCGLLQFCKTSISMTRYNYRAIALKDTCYKKKDQSSFFLEEGKKNQILSWRVFTTYPEIYKVPFNEVNISWGPKICGFWLFIWLCVAG